MILTAIGRGLQLSRLESVADESSCLYPRFLMRCLLTRQKVQPMNALQPQTDTQTCARQILC
jgi:hypothetical protein